MSSSKVWRAGRWFWYCKAGNNASDWRDTWSCEATSRRTYSTKREAEKAGARHEKSSSSGFFPHHVGIMQIRPERGRKKAQRKRR